MKRLAVWCLGVALATSQAATAAAAGETDYDEAYCGGPHGSEPPVFNPATDVFYVLSKVAEYTADPSKLFGPYDRWTNWYEETDMRNALAKLAVMRGILDAYNLWDMYLGWSPPVSCPPDAATVRSIDGTCNDLTSGKPAMGSAGYRFGRNTVPFVPAAHPDYANLMSPNPREVSRKLFTRDGYDRQPVPFLNMLAAAWVQFQVHDWFNHTNTADEYWEIPLEADDPLRWLGMDTMPVRKTAADPTRQPWEAALPPSYPNEVTHWWDGSQLYGSDVATSNRLRSFSGGKLKMGSDGLLPIKYDGFEDTGFRNNWWLGLGLMHNLFAKEHNAIADMLAAAYPDWTDQQLYDKARMINAAVIVKIHTIEWTPAILPNPTLEVGMNANWGGLNQYMDPPLPGLPPGVPEAFSPILFGVAGGKRDLKINALTGQEVPYSLTEEFVSVYRMHALLPDTIDVYKLGKSSAKKVATVPTELTRDGLARLIEKKYGLGNLLYSFGVQNPGQLVLGNYPHFLQRLYIPFVGILDMGAVDVLRDRERGVPRYNEFRRQLRLVPLTSLEELTTDPEHLANLKEVYGYDAGAIERVDLLVGTLAEGTRPTCYGFGETLFQVFTVMATRRIQADRFYTDDFTPEVYTPEGMAWIEAATMKHVLLRHFPELASTGLADVTNAFYPWE